MGNADTAGHRKATSPALLPFSFSFSFSTDSPRLFILGDPVVRRASSNGGFAADAIMPSFYPLVDADQRKRISIETRLGKERNKALRGNRIPLSRSDVAWVIDGVVFGDQQRVNSGRAHVRWAVPLPITIAAIHEWVRIRPKPARIPWNDCDRADGLKTRGG